MDSIICATTCAYINKVGKRTCDWLDEEARKAERGAQERAEADAEIDEMDAGREAVMEESDEGESAAAESLDAGQLSYNILASSWPLFAKITKTVPLYEERAAKYEAMRNRECQKTPHVT